MNCCDEKIDVDIGELEQIDTIRIMVLSGDEILKVRKKDGICKEVDSDRHFRSIDFYDGEYEIYNADKGKNRIEEWQKRKDANEWVCRVMT